jgi:hypothetical protein
MRIGMWRWSAAIDREEKVQGTPKVNKRDEVHCHGNRLYQFAIKNIRRVEMTLQEQENERNGETVGLHAMYGCFDTEKSRTPSDKCF